MKIQKGVVKYKDRDDIICTYGITDDGRQYYFLDAEDEKKFSNGNRIASKALVEAIDPMVKASNVGVIDESGREVIPFNHRSIRPVNDDIVLTEVAEPVSESVIEANNMKSDPALATKLVSTPALIKERLNSKMGSEGRYIFNDQFSEATVYDINGNNLVNNEYFSFIGMGGGKLYFSKNTADSEITEYSILPPEVQSDITPASDTQAIDVSEVEVSSEVVENALNSENVNAGFASTEISTPPALGEDQIVEETAPVVENDATVDDTTSAKEEMVAEEESIPAVAPIAPVEEEDSTKTIEETDAVSEDTEKTEEEPKVEDNTVDTKDAVVEASSINDISIPMIAADESDEVSVENVSDSLPSINIEETGGSLVGSEMPVASEVSSESVETAKDEADTEDTEKSIETEEIVTNIPVEDTSEEEVVEEGSDIDTVEDAVEVEESNVMDSPLNKVVEEIPVSEEDLSVEKSNSEEEVELEETPDNIVDEAEEEEEIDLDGAIEDTTLDDMFHGVSEDDEEDIFKDSIITTDSIIEDTDEFESHYEEPYQDSISETSDIEVEDLGKSVKSLVQKVQRTRTLEAENKTAKAEIKELQAQKRELEARIEKEEATKRNMMNKYRKIEQDVRNLETAFNKEKNRSRNLESALAKRESTSRSLEAQLERMERENAALRGQVKDFQNEYQKVWDALQGLGEDDNYSYEEESYYRRAA